MRCHYPCSPYNNPYVETTTLFLLCRYYTKRDWKLGAITPISACYPHLPPTRRENFCLSFTFFGQIGLVTELYQ